MTSPSDTKSGNYKTTLVTVIILIQSTTNSDNDHNHYAFVSFTFKTMTSPICLIALLFVVKSVSSQFTIMTVLCINTIYFQLIVDKEVCYLFTVFTS